MGLTLLVVSIPVFEASVSKHELREMFRFNTGQASSIRRRTHKVVMWDRLGILCEHSFFSVNSSS